MAERVEAPHYVAPKENIQSPNIVNGDILTSVAQDENFESFRNMSELREKAPEFYHELLKFTGMKICDDMKKHQKRMREIMRKNRENG